MADQAYQMSTLPENEFDLEKLFLPAWAQEPASAKSYANYEGERERPERRDGPHGRRPPRRDGPPGPRRDGRGPRPEGDRRPGGGGQGKRPPRDGRPDGRRGPPLDRREPATPLPEIDVVLAPDEKGTESLARQIRMTGRAYPLFDIAQLILQKDDRYTVTFKVKKDAEGKVAQPLFVCALDETLWFSEADAIGHVLKHHFGTFYQSERTPTEPPKGKYTFVGQCGLSGVVLGPPNHHDYQNRLRKLHAERFSRMPFDVFKSRVKIVRDEEVVKKWVEDQSWKTEYTCLNVAEPLRLATMGDVEKHFREVHKESIIKPIESQVLNGAAARAQRCPQLVQLVRHAWEDQRRFPLRLATTLSQQFAGHGLQFFKVNRTVTHVSVARPHFLDLDATPLSDGIRRIVIHINEHPKSTRRKLLEALAPSPAPATPAPAAATPAGADTAPAQPAPAPADQPTPEQTAVIADLHWLIHQGHVIEFANGILETAKKPLPKPAKPAPKSAPASTVVTESEVAESTPADETQSSNSEVAPQTGADATTAVDSPTTGAEASESTSPNDAPENERSATSGAVDGGTPPAAAQPDSLPSGAT